MSKKIITIIIISLTLCLISFFVIVKSVAKEKDSGEVNSLNTLKSLVEINNIKIPVDLADTKESRQLGLSYRDKLENDSGMLFVMPNRAIVSFWMKDMNFPLDIVWIDGEKVVNISKNLPVGGANPNISYSSLYPVDFVLELNAGFCNKNNLKIGDSVNINSTVRE